MDGGDGRKYRGEGGGDYRGSKEFGLRTSRMGLEEATELHRQVEQLKMQLLARENKIAEYEKKYVKGALQKDYSMALLELKEARDIISQQNAELERREVDDEEEISIQQRVNEMQQIMTRQQQEFEMQRQNLSTQNDELSNDIEELKSVLSQHKIRESKLEENNTRLKNAVEDAEFREHKLRELNEKIGDGRRHQELESSLAEAMEKLEIKDADIKSLISKVSALEEEKQRILHSQEETRIKMEQQIESAIMETEKETNTLRKELVSYKRQIAEMEAERTSIVKSAEESGKEVIELRAELLKVVKGYNLEDANREIYEYKVALKRKEEEKYDLIAEVNKLGKANQALMRDREWLVNEAGLPIDWTLDEKAAADIQTEAVKMRAALLAQRSVVEKLERQRTELLEELHKQAIGVSEKGFTFLGLKPDQSVLVQEYAHALKTNKADEFLKQQHVTKEKADSNELQSKMQDYKDKLARAQVEVEDLRRRLAESGNNSSSNNGAHNRSYVAAAAATFEKRKKSRGDENDDDAAGGRKKMEEGTNTNAEYKTLIRMIQDLKQQQQQQQQEQRQQQQQQQQAAINLERRRGGRRRIEEEGKDLKKQLLELSDTAAGGRPPPSGGGGGRGELFKEKEEEGHTNTRYASVIDDVQTSVTSLTVASVRGSQEQLGVIEQSKEGGGGGGGRRRHGEDTNSNGGNEDVSGVIGGGDDDDVGNAAKTENGRGANDKKQQHHQYTDKKNDNKKTEETMMEMNEDLNAEEGDRRLKDMAFKLSQAEKMLVEAQERCYRIIDEFSSERSGWEKERSKLRHQIQDTETRLETVAKAREQLEIQLNDYEKKHKPASSSSSSSSSNGKEKEKKKEEEGEEGKHHLDKDTNRNVEEEEEEEDTNQDDDHDDLLLMKLKKRQISRRYNSLHSRFVSLTAAHKRLESASISSEIELQKRNLAISKRNAHLSARLEKLRLCQHDWVPKGHYHATKRRLISTKNRLKIALLHAALGLENAAKFDRVFSENLSLKKQLAVTSADLQTMMKKEQKHGEELGRDKMMKTRINAEGKASGAENDTHALRLQVSNWQAKAGRFESLFSQAQTQCSALESKVEDLTKRLSSALQEASDAENRAGESQANLERFSSKIDAEELRKQLVSAKIQVKELQIEVSSLRKEESIHAQQVSRSQALLDQYAAENSAGEKSLEQLEKLLKNESKSDEHGLVGKMSHELIALRTELNSREAMLAEVEAKQHSDNAMLHDLQQKLLDSEEEMHRLWVSHRLQAASAEKAHNATISQLLKQLNASSVGGVGTLGRDALRRKSLGMTADAIISNTNSDNGGGASSSSSSYPKANLLGDRKDQGKELKKANLNENDKDVKNSPRRLPEDNYLHDFLSLQQGWTLHETNMKLANSLKKLEVKASTAESKRESLEAQIERLCAEKEIIGQELAAHENNSKGNNADTHFRIQHWAAQIKRIRVQEIKSRREASVLRTRLDFYKKTLGDAEDTIDALHKTIAEKEEELGSKDIEAHKLMITYQQQLREQEGRLRSRYASKTKKLKGNYADDGNDGAGHFGTPLEDALENTPKEEAALAHVKRLQAKIEEYRAVVRTNKALVIDQDEMLAKRTDELRAKQHEIESLYKAAADTEERNQLEKKRIMTLSKERVESMEILLSQKSAAVRKYQKLLEEAQKQYQLRASEDGRHIKELNEQIHKQDEGDLEKIEGALSVLQTTKPVSNNMMELEKLDSELKQKVETIDQLKAQIKEYQEKEKDDPQRSKQIIKSLDMVAARDIVEQEHKAKIEAIEHLRKSKSFELQAELLSKERDVMAKEIERLKKQTSTLEEAVAKKTHHCKEYRREMETLRKTIHILKSSMLQQSQNHVDLKGDLERRLNLKPNMRNEIAIAMEKEQTKWSKKMKTKQQSLMKMEAEHERLKLQLDKMKIHEVNDRKAIQALQSTVQDQTIKIKELTRQLGDQRAKASDLLKKRRHTARELGSARAKLTKVEQQLFAAEEASKHQETKIFQLTGQVNELIAQKSQDEKEDVVKSGKGGAGVGNAAMAVLEQKGYQSGPDKITLQKLNQAKKKLAEKAKQMETMQARLAAVLKDKSSLTTKIASLRQRLKNQNVLRKAAPGGSHRQGVAAFENNGAAAMENMEIVSKLRGEIFELKEAKGEVEESAGRQSRVTIPQFQAEIETLKKKLEALTSDEALGEKGDFLSLNLELQNAKIELSFLQEQRSAECERLKFRMKELQEEVETYKGLAKAAAAQAVGKATSSTSGIGKGSSLLQGGGKEKGMQRVIDALRRVVSRLQAENLMLEKNSFRTQKYLDLQRDNKQLKKKNVALIKAKQQAETTGDAKTQAEMRRLQDLHKQSRKIAKKEQENFLRMKAKLRSAEEQISKLQENCEKMSKQLQEASKKGAAHSKRYGEMYKKTQKQLLGLQSRTRQHKEELNRKDDEIHQLTAKLEEARLKAAKRMGTTIRKANDKSAIQQSMGRSSRLDKSQALPTVNEAELKILRTKNQNLSAENTQLSEKNRLLMEELSAFDHEFFDEIEDLKFKHAELLKENEMLKAELSRKESRRR